MYSIPRNQENIKESAKKFTKNFRHLRRKFEAIFIKNRRAFVILKYRIILRHLIDPRQIVAEFFVLSMALGEKIAKNATYFR
jgi:hypothetical protein